MLQGVDTEALAAVTLSLLLCGFRLLIRFVLEHTDHPLHTHRGFVLIFEVDWLVGNFRLDSWLHGRWLLQHKDRLILARVLLLLDLGLVHENVVHDLR